MDLWVINLNSSKTKPQKTFKPETISWWSWKLNLASKSLFSFPSGQEKKDHWFIALLLMAPNSFRCIIGKSLVLDLGPDCSGTQEFALRNHTHVLFHASYPASAEFTVLLLTYTSTGEWETGPSMAGRIVGWCQESVKPHVFRREECKDLPGQELRIIKQNENELKDVFSSQWVQVSHSNWLWDAVSNKAHLFSENWVTQWNRNQWRASTFKSTTCGSAGLLWLRRVSHVISSLTVLLPPRNLPWTDVGSFWCDTAEVSMHVERDCGSVTSFP